uniref:BolA-like protein n=1 Tax=Caenorhabditis tropicalis TaxID=1561998 RepID=A0A1I7UT07_9PELO
MLRIAANLRTSFIASAIRQHSACCGGEHQMSEAEQKMSKLLTDGIEGCSRVEVHDVSNGCGSMFDVVVEASSFQGKSKVAQHKIVTSILREQIKSMHGLTIETKAA